MKIYDISRQLPGCEVYPGDPRPEIRMLSDMEMGELYNLSEISMCTHSGTHVDAPRHFIGDGAGVDEIPLYKTVGRAYVAARSGSLDAEGARCLLAEAKNADTDAAKRILIKGDAVISADAARVLADGGIFLIGTESLSVGPVDAPMEVHLILLRAGTVLLEGLNMADVPEGVYLLSAAPLLIKGADGSPCRAVLCTTDV